MAHAALTHRTKTGARYRRPALVEDEIAQVLASQNKPIWCLEGCDWPALRVETWVFLARHRALARDALALGYFVRLILERAQRVARRWSRGLSLADREEIESAVVTRLVELLLEKPPSRTAEFLEINAHAVLKQITLREVAKRRNWPKPHDFAQSGEGGQVLDQIADPNGAELSNAIATGPIISMRSALKAIKDPRHRKAFILHKLRGWPVQSETGHRSLTVHFNMSKRQIHTWIETAVLQVKHAFGEA